VVVSDIPMVEQGRRGIASRDVGAVFALLDPGMYCWRRRGDDEEGTNLDAMVANVTPVTLSSG